jgi:hypothetical protein
MMRKHENTCVTIITAQSGWFVATYCEADAEGPACLNMEPVIAWEVERGVREHNGSAWHWITPLTTHGSPTEYDTYWAIKHPDGKLEVPEDRMLNSEEETFDYFTAEAAKEKQRQAMQKRTNEIESDRKMVVPSVRVS